MSAARWTRANAWVALGFLCIMLSITEIVDIPSDLRDRYVRLMTGLLRFHILFKDTLYGQGLALMLLAEYL